MKEQAPATPTDQPWLIDKRWAGGIVRDQGGAALIFIWVFAIFWNAIAVPAFVFASRAMTTEKSRGRLMTLETKDDRTLFFDMLPFVFRAPGATAGGMTLRVKIFTVPGQVLHASTRWRSPG